MARPRLAACAALCHLRTSRHLEIPPSHCCLGRIGWCHTCQGKRRSRLHVTRKLKASYVSRISRGSLAARDILCQSVARRGPARKAPRGFCSKTQYHPRLISPATPPTPTPTYVLLKIHRVQAFLKDGMMPSVVAAQLEQEHSLSCGSSFWRSWRAQIPRLKGQLRAGQRGNRARRRWPPGGTAR
jgi:hypothetical protein